MKKQKTIKAIAMFFLLGTSIATQAQNLRLNETINPHQAVSLAQKDLSNMLQLIEPEDMNEYGFDLTDDFSQIKIGTPFYVTTLPSMPSTSSETISLNPNTVMLPLILDGRARCVIYVSPEEGQWKVVGIGEHNFVNDKQEIFTTDATSQILISVPQASQIFLLQDEKAVSFLPLNAFEDNASMDAISINALMETHAKAIEAARQYPTSYIGNTDKQDENQPNQIENK